MTSFTIPNKVRTIREATFYVCKSLTTLHIPNSVTSIELNALAATGLKTLKIPSSVISIGVAALSECPNLEAVFFPNTVTSVGNQIFRGSSNALKIYLGRDSSIIEALISQGHEKQLVYHRSVVHQEAIAATCTSEGLTEGSHCTACNLVLIPQKVIPALDHTAVIDAAVAAKCTETGLSAGKHCSVCSEVLLAQTIIPALGHVESAPVVIIEPTETESGVQVFQCVNCREILRSEPLPAIGKKGPGDVNEDAIVDVNDACLILSYCAGQHVDINATSADVNADSNVDIHDALLIMQYVAGWNVTLK